MSLLEITKARLRSKMRLNLHAKIDCKKKALHGDVLMNE